MALYCSREIFTALDGLKFPATKEDILDVAELKDAPEAAIVVLNQLDDKMIFNDVGEVCDNAHIACNIQIMRIMSQATFPAKRENLMDFAKSQDAPKYVMEALFYLPTDYTFASVDDFCEYIS